ncbi:MAG: hypothetical protein GWO38_15665 [Phycisphaerae bacterium]|nr:hypothetical protein [Phycisphaerae bacterium]NIX29022.1 hypothetical protein [Phycisphaerae bacterium]
MDAAMIGKIEKAMQYAQEPDRLSFQNFQVIFKGDHHNHTITYEAGDWTCDCQFFKARGVCSHIMTIERVLAGSVKHAEAVPMPA